METPSSKLLPLITRAAELRAGASSWVKGRGGAIRAGMALDAGGRRLVVQDEQERVLFGQP